ALLCSLVEQGMISLSRIRESARRLLAVKFSLGLFDNPFVDEDQAETVLTRPASHAAGRRAQSRSVTVLEAGDLLPLAPGLRLYAEGIPPEVVAEYGEWVDDPALADVAIVRLEAPWELRDDLPLEHLFHSGSLEFSPGLIWRIEQLAAVLPVILDVRLERPAILTPLLAAITARGPSGALVANYGASGGALLDALTGREEPVGRLPFDLPRSMDAVRASAPDAPGDTPDALYRAGHGLTLTKGTAR
ncbi:MAG: beta-glucosidase, partial [Subtercola sp.]|nr:beta-glucosidase [Subtercola sp.]